MTIEEEFFKTFDIKPDCSYLFLIDGKGTNESARTLSLGSKSDLKRFIVNCGGKGRVVKSTNSPHIYYPEITAEILLQLICIVDNFTIQSYLRKEPFNFETLKTDVLERCIYLQNCGISKDELVQQVRKLFEEE